MHALPHLPWPELIIPAYREGTHGQWSLQRADGAIDAGYFRAFSAPAPNYMLRGSEGTNWMSANRMELESLMPHAAAMRGHVVICGLGMGLALFNAIRKPEVTKITVVEIDPSTEALLSDVAGYWRWPGMEKAEVVVYDALEFTHSSP